MLCSEKKNMACADLFESPRISFSNDFGDAAVSVEGNRSGRGGGGGGGDGDQDFEFCMAVPEDPHSGFTMMPADELFYQGKLLPFQSPKPAIPDSNDPVIPGSIPVNSNPVAEDPSPKAPKFSSSRWKELLRLKKPQNPPPSPKPSKNPKSLKQLLFAGNESPTLPSQPSLPPRDSDADCASARFSIQSLDPDLDDLPRYSVDSINEDSVLRKPLRVNIKPSAAQQMDNKDSKTRIDRSRVRNTSPRRFSDSPRRNASGKIVFKGLERSCSSPSSFNMRKKDPHYSRKGFERSYSANVRVTPVLNVPVCMRSGKGSKGGMFGLSHLFSSNKPNRNPNPNPNPNLKPNPNPCPSPSPSQTKQSSRER